MKKSKIIILFILLPFLIYSQNSINITNEFKITFPDEPNITSKTLKMNYGEADVKFFEYEEDNYKILLVTFELPIAPKTPEDEYSACYGLIHGFNDSPLPNDSLKVFDIEYKKHKGLEYYVKSEIDNYYKGGRVFIINKHVYFFSAFANGDDKINEAKKFFDSFIEIDN